jgi:hypothetical protein
MKNGGHVTFSDAQNSMIAGVIAEEVVSIAIISSVPWA